MVPGNLFKAITKETLVDTPCPHWTPGMSRFNYNPLLIFLSFECLSTLAPPALRDGCIFISRAFSRDSVIQSRHLKLQSLCELFIWVPTRSRTANHKNKPASYPQTATGSRQNSPTVHLAEPRSAAQRSIPMIEVWGQPGSTRVPVGKHIQGVSNGSRSTNHCP